MDEITGASKFASIKDRARKLIHDDARADSHIIAERAKDRNKIISATNTSIPGVPEANIVESTHANNADEIGKQGEYLDKMMNERIDKLKSQVQGQQNITSSYQMAKPINSHLPKEILESFKTNTIDTSKLNPNSSVLDRIGITNGEKEIINEQKSPSYNTSSGIDYGIIKEIVENAVKKYVGALSKKMLNESKTAGNSEVKAMKIGDKFSFITDSGDIYEAKLTFKRNINKK